MSKQTSHSTSVLERFGATHPDLEIWWDSSPFVFESWRSGMIKAADLARRGAEFLTGSRSCSTMVGAFRRSTGSGGLSQ